MVLLEEYYELNENENVSKWWKIMQIFCYICAAGFGIWCGVTMALTRLNFDDKCYLSANIVLLDNQEPQSEKSKLMFDNTNSEWGPDSLCEYCQYSMISSFIFAVIWGTFFLMCGKGGKSLSGLPQPWRIVIPSLLFNFIYFIIAFVASILIQQGTDSFCQKLDENFKPKMNKCKGLEKLLVNHSALTLSFMNTIVKTSWATTAAWFLAFLLPLFRIIFITDFRLIKVCVYKIDDGVQNKTEEIVKVTNYEESAKNTSEENDTEEDIRKMKESDLTKSKVKKKQFVKIKNEDPSSELLEDDSLAMDKKGSTGEIFYIKADIEYEAKGEPAHEEIIEPKIQILDESPSGSVLKRLNRPKSEIS